MTKDELIEYRKRLGITDTQEIDKRIASLKIKSQVDEYLANGGKITQCHAGDRAWEYKPFSIHG